MVNTITVIRNSGALIGEIIIIDDASIEPVSEWQEWSKMRADLKSIGGELKIVRVMTRLGVGRAKAKGASLASAKTSTLVFLDGHSIVSFNWLVSLLSSLSNHPESIVYPAIDIIDGHAHLGGKPIKPNRTNHIFFDYE